MSEAEKLKMAVGLTDDAIHTGAMKAVIELPDSVMAQISVLIGTVLTEDDLRRVRLQSAEKMREQIRHAVKGVMMEQGLLQEVRLAIMTLVRDEIAESMKLALKDANIDARVRLMCEQMINEAGNKAGKDKDGLNSMINEAMMEQVREFVAKRMVINCVPDGATF